MRIFAQALKGFIEIVEADSPPVPTKTFLKRSYHDPWLGRKMTRRIPVTSFEGGTVIASVTPRKFGNITGHTLRPGTVWEINKKTASLLAMEAK